VTFRGAYGHAAIGRRGHPRAVPPAGDRHQRWGPTSGSGAAVPSGWSALTWGLAWPAGPAPALARRRARPAVRTGRPAPGHACLASRFL